MITKDSESSAPESAMVETIADYDQQAAAYAARYSAIDTVALIDEFLGLLPATNPRVLDAGCGTGRDLALMIASGVESTGLDLSLNMLKQARRVAPAATLAHGDLRCLPFGDQSFDGVWSMASLLHLDCSGFAAALAEFVRVLAPGGAVFLSIASGNGSEWRDSSGGRRWFHYHDAQTVEKAVTDAGLQLLRVATEPGIERGSWVNLWAARPANDSQLA